MLDSLDRNWIQGFSPVRANPLKIKGKDRRTENLSRARIVYIYPHTYILGFFSPSVLSTKYQALSADWAWTGGLNSVQHISCRNGVA